VTATGGALDVALRRAAQSGRLLVAVDFDGTVSPIVADPAQAELLPQARDALETLAGLERTWVALVSGRSLADLAHRTALGRPVRLVGSHGIETDDAPASLTDDDAALLAHVRTALAPIVEGVEGVIVESKAASVAVHVRQAERSDAGRVSSAVLTGPARLPGVHTLHGKEVVELAVVRPDKGAAVHRLRTESGADVVLYLGDDATDESAFASLGTSDIGVKVGAGSTAAAYAVDGPEDAVGLLSRLAALRAWHLDAPLDDATLPPWQSTTQHRPRS
jgi:trehalose 6-phosphate phosphatase